MRALGSRFALALVLMLSVVMIAAGFLAGSSLPTSGWLERAYFLAQIVGMLVASVAAVLIWLQITELRQVLNRSDFDSSSQRILRMSELQITHKKEFAQLLRGRVSNSSRSLAEALLDIMDTEMLRRKAMPNVINPLVPPLDEYFADLLLEVPGLAKVLSQRSSWYSDELTALLPTSRRSVRRIKPTAGI